METHGDSRSWYKLLGFALIGIATFIFNGNIRLPGFYYPPPSNAKAEETKMSYEKEENMNLT